MTTATLTTAPNPGAVAMIQLTGDGARGVLAAVTGVSDWPLGQLKLVPFGDVDEGLAVLLREDWAQLMPHGGPRVVTRVMRMLPAQHDVDPRDLYPEAETDFEARMLCALSRAASPAAIDLLLKQPRLWRDAPPEAKASALPLHRLIDPPSVVVVGAPNVGKSTLTNRMLGRAASVVADLPGTTRDWVAGLAEIRGVAVRWMDTPGLRDSGDNIEQQAIRLAQQAIEQADVLIALRDADTDWPALPREADLFVVNKVDEANAKPGLSRARDAGTPGSGEPGLCVAISALNGRNIDALENAILKCLELDAIDPEALWPL